MKSPKPAKRGPMASPGPHASDRTLVDYEHPAVAASVGQPAGPWILGVSVATDIGRVRHNNEDYIQAERILRGDRRYSLWVVADGVGGGPQGERASRTAVETVVDYLVHDPWTDPTVALTEAFALANRNVFEITGEGAAASTMVAALVSEQDGMVYIANVGDSRAYLIAGGEARQITDDHSIVAARIAAGQITAAEARTAPDRNVVTRSIGSETEVLVDMFGPRQLQPNERLVLCTDGIHGMIDDAAIGWLAGGLPLAESAGALVAAAVEAGGKDNATALVGGYAPAVIGAAVPLAGAAARVRGGRRSRRRAVIAAVVLALVLGFVATLAALLVSSSSTPSTPSTAPASAIHSTRPSTPSHTVSTSVAPAPVATTAPPSISSPLAPLNG